MSQLDKNTATLQELIEIANALPEAGAALPELTNPGDATGLKLGKELIDADGNIVVGKLKTNMISLSNGTLAETSLMEDPYAFDGSYILHMGKSFGDAEELHVLEGHTFTSGSSTIIGNSGSMPNRGAVTATLNTSTTSYTIPEGYHNGSGKVGIGLEQKTATPTKSAQDIVPTSGKVLSKVTVNPIPSQYADVSATTLNNPEDVSAGVTFYTNTGDLYTGIFRKDFVRAQNVNQSMDNFTIPVKQATNGTNAYLQIDTHGSTPALGDAVAGNVLAGKSFTSDNGLLLEGTLEVPDLSVVTAEAIDVVKGKTIIGSDGSSISGKLDTSGINISGYTISAELYKNSFAGDGSYILKTTGSVGDAPAENVLEGTTFTSDYSGINVAGTMPNNGRLAASIGNGNYGMYYLNEGYYEPDSYISVRSTTLSVTPSRETQNFFGGNAAPGERYFYSGVTVNPIPSNYNDTSGVTAEAKTVEYGKVFVDAEGNTQTGKLRVDRARVFTNNGNAYIPINSVSTNPGAVNESEAWIDANELGDAGKSQVLAGATFSSSADADGRDTPYIKATGTMPNNGAVSLSLDPFGSADSSVAIPAGYHNGSGKVTLADNLRTELNSINGNTSTSVLGAVTNINDAVDDQTSLISQIQTALQGKAAGGGGDIPMCELTVMSARYVDYVTVENGVITVKTSSGSSSTSVHTLSVCQGSIFVARDTYISSPNAESYGTTYIYQQSSSGYHIYVSSVNIGADSAMCKFISLNSGGAT